MTAPLRDRATDWTGQTYEERLRACAETLFVHHLIDEPVFARVTAQIAARADPADRTAVEEFLA